MNEHLIHLITEAGAATGRGDHGRALELYLEAHEVAKHLMSQSAKLHQRRLHQALATVAHADRLTDELTPAELTADDCVGKLLG
jgi:uncharacterized protein HemY